MQISGSLVLWLVCFDMDLVCTLSGHIISCFKEVKGLTNKLYAHALVWKKTGLHANFRFIGAMVSVF